MTKYDKQWLFERMPLIRFENWGLYRDEDGTVQWRTEDEQRAIVQGDKR